MTPTLSIRKAQPGDAPVLAAFNCAMALETEHKLLLPERVGPGVLRVLNDPSLGFYAVAESGGRVVGCLLVTNEWSDWRNGLFLWIQSVYVEPASRRQGVLRRMYEFIRGLAKADPAICGFRLYVEKDNSRAQRAYESLGMAPTGYLVYEETKPGAEYFGPEQPKEAAPAPASVTSRAR